ncbi:YkgJ family cysteine cluster protein [Methanocalculus taiwanensis]|uniref:YkgJ family cysteine cluster protein n=1 Tax=Methanocalculus taiwanensis TaxID=106207 RepID=A0ABD4TPN4_9EURY|nr:YkgJ family cysteine cluster protein [Methanocalculus taiwanensis]MCQ1539240.1 YkgJ family cysteine cluster protein [Methanocalculus taiwanensis]
MHESRYGGIDLSFECSQCGDCCSHLGIVHVIESDLGNLRYVVRNRYSGERTTVTIDPDKTALFLDEKLEKNTFTNRPQACPFFRFIQKEEKGYCCVHATRPDICRDYGCWRMLILDGGGRRAGRIMESRHLASDDPVLLSIFAEKAHNLERLSDSQWDDAVIRMIRSAGYMVRI